MKTKYIIGVALSAIMLTACENYFDEKYMDNGKPEITDVSTKNYTLEEKDYKSIAKNAKNVEIAYIADSIAGDTVNKPAQTALAAVGKNYYFTDNAAADTYLPAFVANKYPQLSVGSVVNITFNQYEGKTSARNYTVFNDDYKKIWNGAANYYISPGSEEKFAEWIDETFTDAANGAYMFITYNYQNIEPLPYVTTIADILWAQDAIEHEVKGKVGTIVVQASGIFWIVDGTDSIYVKGLVDEAGNKRNVLTNNNVESGDTITIHATFDPKATDRPTFVNAVYISHKKPAAPRRITPVIKEVRTKIYQYDLATKHWNELPEDLFLPKSVYEALGKDKIEHPETVVDIYLRGKYPYAVVEDAYQVAYYDGSKYVLEKYTFNGANFIAEAATVEETLSFEIKEDTWKADISTFYKQVVVGEGQGKLTIVNVDLGSLNFIWMYAPLYGMKGTTYYQGPHAGEAWVVTPAIKLRKAVAPAIQFDHAINYGPQDANREEEMSVWVSTSFDGATINQDDWTKLPWNKFDKATGVGFPEDNSWTFYNSGDMDLSQWAGQTIYIGWRYKALDGWTCSTWEIQNILVHETAQAE